MYLVWNSDQTADDPILISDDEGESWEEANPDGNIEGAIGNFDPDFGISGAAGYNTIYAGNEDGIWRYVIDESSDWEEITANSGLAEVGESIELFPMPTIPPGSGAPDPDGTMYVYQAHDTGGPPPPDASHGMLRTVYPTDRDAGAPDYEVSGSLSKLVAAAMPGRPEHRKSARRAYRCLWPTKRMRPCTCTPIP
jgi:hypothetical protein